MPNWPWSKRTATATATTSATSSATATQVADKSMDVKSMVVNSMDFSGKAVVLDVIRTERAKFYAIIDDPQNWEKATLSGHWQVRDLVGHMIDVTEGYLNRWDMARRGQEVQAIGLPIMAQELDRVALTYRSLPRAEAISRLKTASDKMLAIFDGLTADEWGNFNVTHVYMGPLPTFFYPAFHVMDYGVHTWDMQGNRNAKLDERTAGVLVPYMFVLMQYTVDQDSANGVNVTYGIIVDGDWGGQWRVHVQDGQFTSTTDNFPGVTTTIHFADASEFVLTTFQRIEGGTTSGSPTDIEQIRRLFFRI